MKGQSLVIYLATPYSAPTEAERLANVARATDWAVGVGQKGHACIVPVLSHYVDLRAKELGVEFTYAQWLSWCLSILEQCDAMLYMVSSPGADIEREFALQHGIPIYTCVAALPQIGTTFANQ